MRAAHRPPPGEGITAAVFQDTWKRCDGSPVEVSRALEMNIRGVYSRRNRMEAQGYSLPTNSPNSPYRKPQWFYPATIALDVMDGAIILGADMHGWPGPAPRAWHAFCEVAHSLDNLKAIGWLGDMLDGARVSHYPRIRGTATPNIREEIDVLQSRERELPSCGKKFWTIGNHDSRVDDYVSEHAPEIEDVTTTLAHEFPAWSLSYSCVINDLGLECRHHYRGGIHSARNDTLNAGINIATAHTHDLKVEPFQDRRGVRWGIKVGCLADLSSAAFQYGEGAPTQHREGFAVVTFDTDGRMLPPELCEATDSGMVFRGRVIVGHDYVQGMPKVRKK
jgi:hypothetical protein